MNSKETQSEEQTLPDTLQNAILYFSDLDICVQFVAALRWADAKPTCPYCTSTDAGYVSTRRIFKCKNKECRKQFSVKAGTIFEDSPIGLDKWLVAIWMIANCKNGVSSYEIHRAIGVTQKTAWFMLHRIRVAMQTQTFERLEGTVEVDETYVGGLEKNKHDSKKRKEGRGTVGKAIVMGVLERGDKTEGKTSRVKAKVVKDTTQETLQGEVKAAVVEGAEVFTDAHRSYRGLSAEYAHEFVDHAVKYVEGRVSTNGLENFWSLTKRMLKGTYISVEPEHLESYLDEQTFRFNERKGNDTARLIKTVQGVAGKRLTYKELIGEESRPEGLRGKNEFTKIVDS